MNLFVKSCCKYKKGLHCKIKIETFPVLRGYLVFFLRYCRIPNVYVLILRLLAVPLLMTCRNLVTKHCCTPPPPPPFPLLFSVYFGFQIVNIQCCSELMFSIGSLGLLWYSMCRINRLYSVAIVWFSKYSIPFRKVGLFPSPGERVERHPLRWLQ
jgi:hypothetical protein